MHTPMCCREQGMYPRVYVKVHILPGLEKLSSPAAPPGLRPVWDYHVNTHIPKFYLQAQVGKLDLYDDQGLLIFWVFIF